MVSARGRTVDDWEKTRIRVGARVFNALYQGRPSPETGAVWRKPWWRRYQTPLWTVAADGSYRVDADEVLQSWDMTFKDTKGSDYVVGQVWARRGANAYLLEQVRRRLSFTDTVTQLKALRTRWPQSSTILIEDKANGSAVIDTLRAKVPGIIPVTPHESKYARANAVSPFIEAGNVHLPEGADAIVGSTDPEELIVEAASFPNGAHDDQVDATSQALARLFVDGSGANAWLDWLDRKLTREPEKEPEQVPVLQGMDALRAARQAQVRY